MKRFISLWITGLCTVITLTACSTGGPALSEGTMTRKATGNLRTQTVLLPGHDKPTEVTFEVSGGYAVFQGDINLGKVDEDGFLMDDGLSKEGTVGAQSVFIDNGSWDFRWPNGIIPYDITGEWDDPNTAVDEHQEMLDTIQQAMEHWEDKTPIRFVQQTTGKGYLQIARTDEICSGNVGYYGNNINTMLLGAKCTRLEQIIHELGHTVGLWHEQSRSDRDTYVTIKEENILTDLEHAFEKHVENGKDFGPYDYYSIMHYPKHAFAKDVLGCTGYYSVPQSVPEDLNKCTIVTKDPTYRNVIGSTKVLSQGDIDAVKDHYALDFASKINSGDVGCDGSAQCRFGDMNANGMDEIVTFMRNSQPSADHGDVYVAKNRSGEFDLPEKVYDAFCINQRQCEVADVTGDGRADLVAFVRSTKSEPYAGDVYVAFARDGGFSSTQTWHRDYCLNALESCTLADVNGDRRADLVLFQNGAYNSDDVYVALSTGTSFGPMTRWHSGFCGKGERCVVGDVNGNGKADIVTFLGGPDEFGANGDVYVALSTGSAFGARDRWHKNICYGNLIHKCFVTDVNGDGKADAVMANTVTSSPVNGPGSDVYAALSNGIDFMGSVKRHDLFALSASDIVLSGRINNDDKADLISISPSSNRHHVLNSYIP